MQPDRTSDAFTLFALLVPDSGSAAACDHEREHLTAIHTRYRATPDSPTERVSGLAGRDGREGRAGSHSHSQMLFHSPLTAMHAAIAIVTCFLMTTTA